MGMTQFNFQYVMFMNKKTMFSITNKENEPLQQASKTANKSFNLGKMVKCKAHIMPSYSPILKQQKTIQNRFPFIQTPKINDRRTNALMSQPTFDLDDISVKNKSVRFEDQNTFGSDSRVTLQFSRNKKKSTSILKKSNSIDKMSMDSCNSDMGQLDFLNPKNSLKDKGLACSNDKYFKEVKDLKYENVKFFDKIFPPGGASLCYSKQKILEFKNVRWARIQDVFKGKKPVLYSQNNHFKGIYNQGAFNYGYNFAVACNSLSNSNRCLQRIFEDQKVNGLCIYYLRINQDGIWKYTIVDDYIPVINSGGADFPAFMNVSQNQFGQVQIWPFLLQKAFAKIYNCYQSLFDDSVENLLFDFTGFPCEDIDLDNQADQFKFRSTLTHAHSVAIVSKPLNSSYFSQECYPLRQDKGPSTSAYFSLQTRMKLMELKKYKNLVFQVNDIKKQFKKAKVFSINDSYYSLGCIIKQAKGTISLRKFSIKQRTANCIINLIQKDKKYYHNNGYEYVWSRVMVVMKDGSNGYRWIDGKYKNERINSLCLNLQPGEYFVVMNGDWNNKVFQMYLNYQGNQEIQFVRQNIDKYPSLLTQMCVDIAQRFGNLKQINRNLCSYSLIDRINGFLIQNVNNQVDRPIFYHKSYPLKGKNYELLDKTIQFEDQQNVVEIKINANYHFTFIAKLINGYDCELLENFNFY